MRKWTRSRFRKKKDGASDTEQTGKIGQSRETFQGAQPLQPNYYDAPPDTASGAPEMDDAPAMDEAAGADATPAPPARVAPTARAPQGRSRRGSRGGRFQTPRPAETQPAPQRPPQDHRIENETQPESLGLPSPNESTGRPRSGDKAPRGTVVLTIGLPGSGKTTWYKRRSVTPLSTDILRSLLFDDITEQRYQSLVFSTLRSLLRARLIAKMPWNYVDATNLSPRERKQWIQMAKSFGYEVHAVYFDVPLEVCLERNSKRDRRVPEDIMHRMAEKLKPPTFDEGFSKITVVRVKSKGADDAPEDGA